MASADKRARFDDGFTALSKFRASLPHMSSSALGAVLQRARRESLPTGCRKKIKAARERLVSQPTPYGPLVGEMCVGEEYFPVLNPAAWLYKISEFENVQELLAVALANLQVKQKELPAQFGPGVVLDLIIYADEITPGNVISHKNRRKSWAVYFAILQLGPELLCQEVVRLAKTRARL